MRVYIILFLVTISSYGYSQVTFPSNFQYSPRFNSQKSELDKVLIAEIGLDYNQYLNKLKSSYYKWMLDNNLFVYYDETLSGLDAFILYQVFSKELPMIIIDGSPSLMVGFSLMGLSSTKKKYKVQKVVSIRDDKEFKAYYDSISKAYPLLKNYPDFNYLYITTE